MEIEIPYKNEEKIDQQQLQLLSEDITHLNVNKNNNNSTREIASL